MERDRIELTGLKVPCIIGVFDWERRRKQTVVLDLSFPARISSAARTDRLKDAADYKAVSKACIAFVSTSRYQLVERLASELVHHLFQRFPIPEITLKVSKPGAIRGSRNVGVVIRRVNPDIYHEVVFLGLGSNIQPRLHLVNALRVLDERAVLLYVSHVYETSPVGRKGQPLYWNMAVGLVTNEKPGAFRRFLGSLEEKEGRVRSKDKFASRPLDADILLWGRKVAPHPDVLTRAHALFPLVEIVPDLIHPAAGKPLLELAASFKGKGQKFRMLPADTMRYFPPSR